MIGNLYMLIFILALWYHDNFSKLIIFCFLTDVRTLLQYYPMDQFGQRAKVLCTYSVHHPYIWSTFKSDHSVLGTEYWSQRPRCVHWGMFDRSWLIDVRKCKTFMKLSALRYRNIISVHVLGYVQDSLKQCGLIGSMYRIYLLCWYLGFDFVFDAVLAAKM